VLWLLSIRKILGSEVVHNPRHMCSYQQHIPLWKGPLDREHRNKFVQTEQERDHCNPVNLAHLPQHSLVLDSQRCSDDVVHQVVHLE
jgi:hypothetical protein